MALPFCLESKDYILHTLPIETELQYLGLA
jgi:hypothetical protein